MNLKKEKMKQEIIKLKISIAAVMTLSLGMIFIDSLVLSIEYLISKSSSDFNWQMRMIKEGGLEQIVLGYFIAIVVIRLLLVGEKIKQ